MREKIGSKSSLGKALGALGSPLGSPMGGAHRNSENLRRCGGTASRASQKSSLLYDYFDGNDAGPQRSVSLTMLGPVPLPLPVPTSPGSVCTNGDPDLDLQPRMAQLETLEAKMASIEVSLSTTPRRKKNGSIGSAAGVTAGAVVAGVHPGHPGHPIGNGVPAAVRGGVGVGMPVSNRDVARELETLRHALREKENLIQSLRGQLIGSPGGAPTPAPPTPAPPSTASTWPGTLQQRPPLSEDERKAAEERLSRLRQDADTKRLAIKHLKMALERLDITDNIDVRIQQAELEYQLGREELNLLSLLEDTRSVSALLEEAERARSSQAANTLYSCVGALGRAVLVTVQVQYDPKSPQFGAGPRDDAPGLYVHWATDTCGMLKGDRVVEVNGKLVLCKGREDMLRLLAVSPDPALLVLLREPDQPGPAAPEPASAPAPDPQLQAALARAMVAERAADGLRADSVRLSHRISYLEDQVSELLGSAGSAGPQRSASANVSTVIVTAPTCAGGDMQLYQKGSQAQLVGGLEHGLSSLRCPDRKRQSQSQLTLATARSTNSLDVFSAESPRGLVQHIRIRQPVSGNQTDGLASDSDVRRPSRRKSDAPGSDAAAAARYYRKHHEYNDREREREREGAERDGGDAGSCSSRTVRPVPPRKPLRLSLHRAASQQSVESAPPTTTSSAALPGGDKKAPKRNHKGEAPSVPGVAPHPIPSDAEHPHPFQSALNSSSAGHGALRWTASSPSPLHQVFRSARSSSNLMTEKWC